MIGHITLGANGIPRAAAFHDALLAELGGKRFMDDQGFVAWQFSLESVRGPRSASRGRSTATGSTSSSGAPLRPAERPASDVFGWAIEVDPGSVGF